MTSLYYLAAPYYHEDPIIRNDRAEAVTWTAAYLMETKALVVFSPITHGVGLLPHLTPEVHHNSAFWMRQDRTILRRCDALLILPLQGWRVSAGIQEEIAVALATDIPIMLVQSSRDAFGLEAINTFDNNTGFHVERTIWI